MNLAKVSANGQVTVPAEVRKRLHLKAGDKILFAERGEEIIILNASASAIVKAQAAFSGAAKNFGVTTENDVQGLVNEVRYGKDE